MLTLGKILEVLHQHDDRISVLYDERFEVFSQPFSPVKQFKASPQSVFGINHDGEDMQYYAYYTGTDGARRDDLARFIMLPIARLAAELINAANAKCMERKEQDYIDIDPMDIMLDTCVVMDYYYEVFYKLLPLVNEGSTGYGFIIDDDIGEIKCITGLFKVDRYGKRCVLTDRCGAIKYETFEASTIVGYEIVKKMIIDLYGKLIHEENIQGGFKGENL